MKPVIIVLLLFPFSVQADVFRCQGHGGTYFSQIPCEAESEPVVIEDHKMFSETSQGAASSAEQSAVSIAEQGAVQEDSGEKSVRTADDGMREFVDTLRRQREEQMVEIDRQIQALESKLNSVEDSASDNPERLDLGRLLAAQYAARSSVSVQYESMISEAERRLSESTNSSL